MRASPERLRPTMGYCVTSLRPVFHVRETPDWKRHAADIEAEKLMRGMAFKVIDWCDGQATRPF